LFWKKEKPMSSHVARENVLGRRRLLQAAGLALAAGPLARLNAHAAPAKASPWQIGCYTRPWDQQDCEAALDGIAAAGYKHAALMTAKGGKGPFVIHAGTNVEDAAAVGERARKRGLTILNVYAGEPPVAAGEEAGAAGLKRMIDNTAACGCGGLMLGGIGKAELVDAYCRVVAQCCDYAAAKKVSLSVKPHGGQNATGPQLRRMIEKVNHANFRLWYDPGNVYYYSAGKLDPVEDVKSVAGLIVGMSVKDFQAPKNVNVTPGSGLVRWKELFAALKAGGFVGGPLVVECTARGAGVDVTAEARKARLFLEEITAP